MSVIMFTSALVAVTYIVVTVAQQRALKRQRVIDQERLELFRQTMASLQAKGGA